MNIELSERAAKDLAKLRRAQPAMHERVITKVQTLAENPSAGKPLVGPIKGTRSLRIGEYRVLYEPHKDHVLIMTVNHRKEVYR